MVLFPLTTLVPCGMRGSQGNSLFPSKDVHGYHIGIRLIWSFREETLTLRGIPVRYTITPTLRPEFTPVLIVRDAEVLHKAVVRPKCWCLGLDFMDDRRPGRIDRGIQKP